MKINLIPEVKQEQNRIRQLNVLITTIATGLGILIGVITIILLVYIGGRTAQLATIKNDIKKVEGELVVYQELEKTVITLEKGLAQIKQILSGEKKWTNFFAELEKATPNDIQIRNIDIKEGEIRMSLNGKDVNSIDRFIKSFSTYKYKEKELFNNVKVTGYTSDGSKVSFQATLNLNQGVLW